MNINKFHHCQPAHYQPITTQAKRALGYVFFALIALVLSACGQKGPLVMPLPAPAATTTATTAAPAASAPLPNLQP